MNRIDRVAQAEGIAARRAGAAQADNPHKPRTDARTAWATGWMQAAELWSGREDDPACRACGLCCYEEGGCPMWQKAGGPVVSATYIESDGGAAARAAYAAGLRSAYRRLHMALAAASPEDLVANRRAFLAGGAD